MLASTRSVFISLLGALTLASMGCTRTPTGDADGESSGASASSGVSTAGDASSTSAGSDTEAESETEPSTSEAGEVGEDTDADDGNPFVTEPDNELECGLPCDIYDANSCGEDEKCMAVNCVPDKWGWNDNRCRPIYGNAQAGDPCSIQSGEPNDGHDDCERGALCFFVDGDTQQGICLDYCHGSSESPECGAGFSCNVPGNGILPICVDDCHPVDQDCPGELECLAWSSYQWQCQPSDDDRVGAGEACEGAWQCQAGLACESQSALTGFCPEGEDGCCTPYCDTTDPTACNELGLQCEGLDPLGLPPDLQNLGVCIVI